MVIVKSLDFASARSSEGSVWTWVSDCATEWSVVECSTAAAAAVRSVARGVSVTYSA